MAARRGAAVAVIWALAALLVEGAAAAPAPGDAPTPAQQRTQERRRERAAQRQWITVPTVSVEEARGLVGTPGVAVIDVTCRETGARYARRIPGAQWQDCTRVEQWAPRYRGAGTVLVYCA